MNCKLEVVKQETARVNIDILGISELKWIRMGEFNSDDHYIYSVGKNPLEEMDSFKGQVLCGRLSTGPLSPHHGDARCPRLPSCISIGDDSGSPS